MGIPCELSLSHENIALDSERSTAIFRVFQETLTNIARHAEATRIEASLAVDQGEIVLIVKDNGKVITEKQLTDPQSFGLVGMRERIQFWGGEIEIKGMPERRTTVTVSLPLH